MAKKKPSSKTKKQPVKKVAKKPAKKPAKKTGKTVKFAPIVLKGKRPKHLKFKIGRHPAGTKVSLSWES